MNIEIKDILPRLIALTEKLRKYAVFICILLALLAYFFIVLQIRNLASEEPDATVVTTKLNDLNPPKVDRAAVEKIEKLEQESIEVHALFEQARDNPFQE